MHMDQAGTRPLLRLAASRLISRGAVGRWLRGILEGLAIAAVLWRTWPEQASGRLIVTAGLALVAILGLSFSFLWSFLEVLGETRAVTKAEQRTIALLAGLWTKPWPRKDTSRGYKGYRRATSGRTGHEPLVTCCLRSTRIWMGGSEATFPRDGHQIYR
jgi:hypothetical protein